MPLFRHVQKAVAVTAAHVLYVLAQNRGLVQDTSKIKKSTAGAKVKAKDRSGHGALR